MATWASPAPPRTPAAIRIVSAAACSRRSGRHRPELRAAGAAGRRAHDALDVTIQAQNSWPLLLTRSNREHGTAIVLVTHTWGGGPSSCQRDQFVMYAEAADGTRDHRIQVSRRPAAPYTRGLLRCLPETGVRQRRIQPTPGLVPDWRALPGGCPFSPRCDRCHEHLFGRSDAPSPQDAARRPFGALSSRLSQGLPCHNNRWLKHGASRCIFHPAQLVRPAHHRAEKPVGQAVDGVDLVIYPGETLGLVGTNPGAAQTTWAGVLVRLYEPTAGQVPLPRPFCPPPASPASTPVVLAKKEWRRRRESRLSSTREPR